ncbi:hypothetical protein H112_02128 [Trichophyton rubrum D6]|uniref:CENP-V/GFA domain-containing protein n=4 Tax=Trichophyton TaxID=5550 RepID=F2SWH0_TRIRC|nr:uncharacterized protein TERG_06890 [Trichophyton rubrum CBS 118892]EZF25550.1 hypothetical protein H100_02126 [Trichophyton rubrum MR850]EZF44620.1 hypothetical protein H102_02124 [Trichophyton rubrum CBS 100081]EZF55304.1 hypothetical protein H103_02132 [Trichophyton rubrum CBS 288.86]EZF65942.1 hypothetical protein H104_02108 [Trichophyton rubrum CBS 289.86]EZF76500.1 hypothetical protein H105_02140 [Trichophyton soudanense CBS 452.61]EZF87220.1 hypothetical protein H110_02129 [Trichophy
MSAIQGKCHCGAVEYTAKLGDKSHILCHCDACKRINGSDFTLNQVIPKADLEIKKGDLTKYTYKGDSGNPVHCCFCPTCSTHIYHHQTALGDDKYILRTASLEGNKEWPASVEIYCKDRAKWQPDVAPKVCQAGPE